MELNLDRVLVILVLCLLSLFIFRQQLYAQQNTRTIQMIGAEFSEVLKYTDANMWNEATKRVEALNNSVAFDIFEWLRLRAGSQDFSAYESFLLVNDDWPGMGLLRSKAENAINTSVQSIRVLNFFSNQEPITANGSLKLAEVLLVMNEIERAHNIIKESWLNHNYSYDQIKKAFSLFGPFLKQYNSDRIDNLLWLGRLDQAEMMLPHVSNDLRILSNARIALKKQSSGVDALIRKVPKDLINEPGLQFDRFLYRQKKNLHESAEQMLHEVSTSSGNLGKPSFWAKGRSTYARRALISGEPAKAYKIASNHFINFSDLKVGKDSIELEWLAGFIAFEFLQEYETALRHFQIFSQFVINPINQAKANYWIGRSYEKLSQVDQMMVAFANGAKYQTTFYGQLSAERGHFPPDSTIVSLYGRYDWAEADFMENSNVKSAILLYYSGRSVLADRFFNHISENLNRAEKLKLSQLAHDLGLKASGLSIAKTAGKNGIFCPEFLFPYLERGLIFDPELEALLTAIIRQESGFFNYIKSSAGALGLMQIMPSTGEYMAKKQGLIFSADKLLVDKNYNIKIGQYFIKTLLRQFDGSKVLSIAAYNAGPYRVKEWIKRLGDPRAKGTDPLVWIEMIPFAETRNYVKRVMEADWVYSGKLIGKPKRLNLGWRTFGHRF